MGLQIVKKVDLEAQRGPRQNQRRKRNPIEDLRREVSIMRTLRHKNIVSLQVWFSFRACRVLRVRVAQWHHPAVVQAREV